MQRVSKMPLTAHHSTPTAASVAAFAADHYPLPGPLTCVLLTRGLNDTFGITAADGTRTVLRLSRHLVRTRAELESEARFVAALDRAGVAVATPVMARSGELVTQAEALEGPRLALLFRHADGRVPRLDAPEDARAQGETLARLHDAADGLAGQDTRQALDLDRLLHRPLATLFRVEAVPASVREWLEGLAMRLDRFIASMDGLGWTGCHGDCHGLNAVIVEDGARRGQARFFDFDDGAPGYLAYDLAVHLWAQVSFGRSSYPMWHAFVAGYRGVRAIQPVDLEAVHAFVLVRHIWFTGIWAGRLAEWGTNSLSATVLERQVEFLRAWERERVLPGLLTPVRP